MARKRNKARAARRNEARRRANVEKRLAGFPAAPETATTKSVDEQRVLLKVAFAMNVGQPSDSQPPASRPAFESASQPQLRRRKEILEMFKRCHGEAALALAWALGSDDESFARPLSVPLRAATATAH